MTKNTIEVTMDWYKSLRRKGNFKLTEYNKNGKALKSKYVKL